MHNSFERIAALSDVLDSYRVGSIIEDCFGVWWRLNDNGRWSCKNGSLTSWAIADYYSPFDLVLTPLPEEVYEITTEWQEAFLRELWEQLSHSINERIEP